MKRITWIQAVSRSRCQFLKTVVAAVAFAVAGLTAHPAAFADNER